ncbi:uncharacterized protein ASCRUDRAFT_48865 [Ascoidea rubescens DSM 1968]|uniref:Uncharacterized protein n=1 Tax=Ascoidea rubescens DSM 1968 TaxID=1344418 RepID=A0A1D2VDF1_9ASCO|nr:hypothetical protein ASCRUDRAFT_48865 [Ascoidea rubescens DSM 1968]ODV59612.1 hypothetical protein ASCRUDRAFT_48865 [Ascoidea rubescens DSM 1968]
MAVSKVALKYLENISNNGNTNNTSNTTQIENSAIRPIIQPNKPNQSFSNNPPKFRYPLKSTNTNTSPIAARNDFNLKSKNKFNNNDFPTKKNLSPAKINNPILRRNLKKVDSNSSPNSKSPQSPSLLTSSSPTKSKSTLSSKSKSKSIANSIAKFENFNHSTDPILPVNNLSLGTKSQKNSPNSPNLSKSSSSSSLSSSISTSNFKRNFSIKNKESVIGLKGRKKLIISEDDQANLNQFKIDSKINNLQGYEYLCRVGEAKQWLQNIIQEELPSEHYLTNDALRDGVILAKLTKKISPNLVKKIIPSNPKNKNLQFKHTENINCFFKLFDLINMPEIFRFELTDLYDKKNIPKVIFSIHALSYILVSNEVSLKKNSNFNLTDINLKKMDNLVGKLNFTNDEILNSQKILDNSNTNLNNFNDLSKSATSKSNINAKISRKKSVSFNNTPEISYIEDNNTNNEYSPVEFDKKQLEVNMKMLDIDDCSPQDVNQITKKSDVLDDNDDNDDDDDDNEAESMELDILIDSIIKVQAISRGSIFRYNMFVNKLLLKSFENDIIMVNIVTLQSKIRGNLFRNYIKLHQRDLILDNKNFIDSIIALQSKIRSNLFRKKSDKKSNDLLLNATGFTQLFSVIRGNKLRNDLMLKHFFLNKFIYEIVFLQSFIRSKNLNQKVSNKLNYIDLMSNSSIKKFQSIIRSKLLQSRLKAEKKVINSNDVIKSVEILQSSIRSLKVKKKLKEINLNLWKYSDRFIDLQSIARGGLLRKNLNFILDTIDFNENKINELVSISRGKRLRKNLQLFNQELNAGKSLKSIVEVQSIVKGLLSRYKTDVLLDELDLETDVIIELQSIIRGGFLRSNITKMFEYYNKNVDKVIKVQNYIRSKLIKNSYQKLIMMENPPLSIVKNYAYLLNDTEKDFQEEMVLSNLKQEIKFKTTSIKKLEDINSKLDIKIALLVKNKITLDELIKQRNNGYNGYKVNSTNNQVGLIDITSLNKNTRMIIENYQSLFYLLQTQPDYLTRIMNQFISKSKYVISNESDSGFQNSISSNSNKRHNIIIPKREEFLFIRFLIYLIEFAFDFFAKSIDDFIISFNFASSKLLFLFNSCLYQKKKLRKIVQDFIVHIANLENLSLESDPVKIYESHLKEESKKQGKKILPNPQLKVEEIIQEPIIRNKFISNLQNLRELTNLLISIIEKKLFENPKAINENFPIHIRLICFSIYKKSIKKFPTLPEKNHLGLIGSIFIDNYLNMILKAPENFGLDVLISKNLKENLGEVGLLLYQTFLMKPFGIDNVYLQPLNDFIYSLNDRIGKIMKELIKGNDDIESAYNMTVFDDIIAHHRPTLLIELKDMINIFELIRENLNIVCIDKQATIREYIIEIIKLSKDTKDLRLIIGSKEFKLMLDPQTSDISNTDVKTNTLLIQAKRCILYIMRVQEADNLYELLVKKIELEDEIKYKKIIEDEMSEKMDKSIYTKDKQGSLGVNLSKITFHDLKCLSLERILELDSIGKISREDNFQSLLNQISFDIKTKHNQRLKRQKEIKLIRQTIKGLENKEEYLKNLLKVYNSYIEKAMINLQRKPTLNSNKKLINIFSKQYAYQRKLIKQGKVPKFGSFKYSGKYLYEHKILKNLKFGGNGLLELNRVNFMFSSDEIGVFLIEVEYYGNNVIPNAVVKLTLDNLLQYQYENKEFIEMFSGMAQFETNTLLTFIFKKFYDNQN